jgi:RNA methyltransferase, TrmH family
MITSTRNPKIQWVRSLQSRAQARREEGAFVVEGVRLAEEALAAGWEARLLLYTEELGERGRAVVSGYAARGIQLELVAPHVMQAASDVETPQGILAVLSRKDVPLPEVLDFAFIAGEVRDPGNLGTMLRTAAASGVKAVFTPPGTVDSYSPKVLRAAMGAHFRLPVHSLAWEDIRAHLNKASLRVYLADAGQGTVYTAADFRLPLALIVGGEAEGTGVDAESLAHDRVRIPMPGGTESLNAAAAAAILLFEVVRQRGD